MSAGALHGLHVLDLTNQLSGPYCSMLLADLGADAIKVERPGSGDEARAGGPHVNGESAPFMIVNRNKRSITVDLKSAEGRAIAIRLASSADVVVENWRPGTAVRLGLGWNDLHSLNPRLVYCSTRASGRPAPMPGAVGSTASRRACRDSWRPLATNRGPPARCRCRSPIWDRHVCCHRDPGRATKPQGASARRA